MKSKRLSPEEILAKANNVKDRFSAAKGKADQMISDNLSQTVNELLQMLQRLLTDRAQDDARIKSLEVENLQLKEKLPKAKKLPNTEVPPK